MSHKSEGDLEGKSTNNKDIRPQTRLRGRACHIESRIGIFSRFIEMYRLFGTSELCVAVVASCAARSYIQDLTDGCCAPAADKQSRNLRFQGQHIQKRLTFERVGGAD